MGGGAQCHLSDKMKPKSPNPSLPPGLAGEEGGGRSSFFSSALRRNMGRLNFCVRAPLARPALRLSPCQLPGRWAPVRLSGVALGGGSGVSGRGGGHWAEPGNSGRWERRVETGLRAWGCTRASRSPEPPVLRAASQCCRHDNWRRGGGGAPGPPRSQAPRSRGASGQRGAGRGLWVGGGAARAGEGRGGRSRRGPGSGGRGWAGGPGSRAASAGGGVGAGAGAGAGGTG